MTRIGRLIDKITGTVTGGPQAWRRLGHARRRDLLHHIRQGRPDPDPAVWAIAVGWARWQLAMSWWRRLLRAAGIALGVYLAIGVAFFAVLLIPGGSVEIQRGYWWVLRDGVGIGFLVYWFSVIPWLDARKIDQLSRSNSLDEASAADPLP